jgi:hypothetical protein
MELFWDRFRGTQGGGTFGGVAECPKRRPKWSQLAGTSPLATLDRWRRRGVIRLSFNGEFKMPGQIAGEQDAQN